MEILEKFLATENEASTTNDFSKMILLLCPSDVDQNRIGLKNPFQFFFSPGKSFINNYYTGEWIYALDHHMVHKCAK